MTAAELWTQSRLSAFSRCMRLHHLRYVLGIGDGGSDVARFGSVGHAAIEVWLRHRGAGDEADLAVAECDALPDRYEVARLRATITGYCLRWGGEQWRVLEVEVEFSFLLGAELIGGKIDAIIEDVSDDPDRRGVWVVEHKFTSLDSSPGSAYWERLIIDRQVSIYVDGAAILGYEIRGVIYDVIAKPGHEPARATPVERRKYTQAVERNGKGCVACGGRAGGKKGPARGTGKVELNVLDEAGAIVESSVVACMKCGGIGWAEEPKSEPSRLYAGQRDTDESIEDFEQRVVDAIAAAPDTYYRRGRIVRLADELPAMRADVLDTIRLAKVASAFDVHPRNSDACSKFGSLCSYFDGCAGRISFDDTARFPRVRAHAELAAPTTTP